jgi:Nuclease-related domain
VLSPAPSLARAATLFVRRGIVWFLAGLELAAFLPAFRAAFTTHEYQRLTDAAPAEEFTAAELRRLRLKGWKRVDHVEFHAYDVDHVMVGPGGVFVIETKYTNVPWPISDNRFENSWANDAAAQARRNADHIKALIAQKLKTSYDAHAILMIWGDGRPNMDGPTELSRGAVIATGGLLRRQLASQVAVLSSDDVDRVAHELRAFVTGKEFADRARRLASA